MPIAAVPNYLGTDFQHASPGMRFGMYLKLWEGPGWSKTNDRPLDGVKRLNENDKKVMRALLSRQQQAFDAAVAPGAALRLDALTIAPFTTGLGNEHPLENGFAFLSPYGLPYLPGSGVKGVLRQAACEVAGGEWGEAHGWSDVKSIPLMQGEGDKRRAVLEKDRQPVMLSMLDVLFGPKSAGGENNHLRGALVFWDVIPQVRGNDLAVEIMTPHQKHYYQDGGSPHDSGQPNPISFLTVPPGSGFTFHVQCNLAHLNRLAPELAANGLWKTLLEAAFTHAFQWLGFGAKTAVGYGAMRHPAAKASGGGAVTSPGAQMVTWEAASLGWNKGSKTLTAVSAENKTATSKPGEGSALFEKLPEEVRTALAKGKSPKMTLTVEPAGGKNWSIVSIVGA